MFVFEFANNIFMQLYPKVLKVGHPCAGYVRRVTHDEIADAIG
jgi:hypothetical protein